MAVRKGKSRTVGRSVHIPRKPRAKRVSMPKSTGFLEDIEAYSDPDAKVAEEIVERRAEARKQKKEEGE